MARIKQNEQLGNLPELKHDSTMGESRRLLLQCQRELRDVETDPGAIEVQKNIGGLLQQLYEGYDSDAVRADLESALHPVAAFTQRRIEKLAV